MVSAPREGETPTLSTRYHGPELALYRSLFTGARAGDADTVAVLIRRGLDLNCVGPKGATPLHIAARFGQLAVVRLLLAHGANPHLADDKGNLPAEKAKAAGFERIVDALRVGVEEAPGGERGADRAPAASAYDPRCRSLCEAAHRGDCAVIARLLAQPTAATEKSAGTAKRTAAEVEEVVRLRGPRGATALHVAARYGHADAAHLLLNEGADPAARDLKGNTAAEKAEQASLAPCPPPPPPPPPPPHATPDVSTMRVQVDSSVPSRATTSIYIYIYI